MVDAALSRRSFLRSSSTAWTAAAFLGVGGVEGSTFDPIEAEPNPTSDNPLPANFPSQDPEAVREIVGVSHFNPDRVQKMISDRPALAKVAWDWGFGDWESAIGAASHTGRKDIVRMLTKSGARPTIFTYAMLGQRDAVRSIIEANPGIQRLHGPHGITLLAHARAGGADAIPVVKYLLKLGGADVAQTGTPVPDSERAAIIGVYAFGTREDQRFKVYVRKGDLAIKRGNAAPRYIFRVAPRVYHPTGAPAVRIRFEASGEQAAALSIMDADLMVQATRIPS